MTDTPKQYQLKPCPFCGSVQCAQGVDIVFINESVSYVQCRDCGIETAPYTEIEEAVTAWNTRDYEPVRGDGWQSIERAPRDGTPFLAYEYGGYYKSSVSHIDNEGQEDEVVYYTRDTGEYACSTPEPTHFMLLPPPPKTEEQQG